MSKIKSLSGMGFKNLPIFNQSLLEKQGWRFLLYLESFVNKGFKGKYFPTTDFLAASVERHPSYGWRSILFGRELLNKGIRWRIGNGDKVQVSKDP